MSKIQHVLDTQFASAAARLVAEGAKASLIQNKTNLSGEDSELDNTWEEICVQVQDEESFYWEGYKSVMQDAVLGALKFIEQSARAAIWLQTDAGFDFSSDLEDKGKDGEVPDSNPEGAHIPVNDEDIADYIISDYLIPMADSYSNDRIEHFLYSEEDDYDEEDLDAADDELEVNEEASESNSPISEIGIYRPWDSDNYYLVLNRHYIFVADSTVSEPVWQFIHPKSTRWEDIHQLIYWAGRVDQVEKQNLPKNFPPLPATIPPDAVNPPPLPPPEPILATEYPVLTRYLLQCEGGAMAIFLVLFEDRYETFSGEGEFHFPKDIFLDLESAKTFKRQMATGEKYGLAYHIRPGLFWLHGDTIEYSVACQSYDRFDIPKVLSMLTSKIEHSPEIENKQDVDVAASYYLEGGVQGLLTYTQKVINDLKDAVNNTRNNNGEDSANETKQDRN